MAPSMKMTVLWAVALCSLVEVYGCVRGKPIPDYKVHHPRRHVADSTLCSLINQDGTVITWFRLGAA
jgi:hypothetical protein